MKTTFDISEVLRKEIAKMEEIIDRVEGEVEKRRIFLVLDELYHELELLETRG